VNLNFWFTGTMTNGGGHERWTNGVFTLHIPSSSKILSFSLKKQLANIRRAASLTAQGKGPKDDPRFLAGQRQLAHENGMKPQDIAEVIPVGDHEDDSWKNQHWYKEYRKFEEQQPQPQPEQPEVNKMAKAQVSIPVPDVPTTEGLIAAAFNVTPNGVNVAARNGSVFRKKYAVLRFTATTAHKKKYRNAQYMMHLVPHPELHDWIGLLEEKHGAPCVNKSKFKARAWPPKAEPKGATGKATDGTAAVISSLEMDLANLENKHATLKEDYRKLQKAHDAKLDAHTSSLRKLRDAQGDLDNERRARTQAQNKLDAAVGDIESARNAYEELLVKNKALENAPAAFGAPPQPATVAPSNDRMYQLAARMILDAVPEGTKQSENLKAMARIMLAPYLDDE
jgi:hypothetical protein